MKKLVRLVSGSKNFIENLKTEDVAFRLVGAYTETCEIKNISFAGLPGMLHYTPAADMEMLVVGKSLCLSALPESPEGPPSPVLLSFAVKKIFDLPVYLINAGLKIQPEVDFWDCGVKYSKSILEGAEVDTVRLIEKGFEYAEKNQFHKLEIIAECVPGGTTTAYSLCKSLGYNCDNLFSGSSIIKNSSELKKNIVNKSIEKFGHFKDVSMSCRYYGDNMQPFVAALTSKLSLKTKVVLAGGTQMLAVYALMKQLNLDANFENIAVITTRWIIDDKNSNFKKLAEIIDDNMNTFCSEFVMNSNIENLALYENGMVKEGVGAGALLAYAFTNGITNVEILKLAEKKYREIISK